MQYVDYPESKFDGDIGILEREYVYADGLVYIGKEANNIGEQALEWIKYRCLLMGIE